MYSRMEKVKFAEDNLTWSILEYFVPKSMTLVKIDFF